MQLVEILDNIGNSRAFLRGRSDQLMLIVLLWLCVMLHGVWPSAPTLGSPTILPPTPTPPKRSREPTPFAGLLHKPLCDACAHAADDRPKAPSSPPPVLTFTRGRKRTIDTQQHFCPDQDCAYYGWTGRGNIRANGHPGGKPWRQLQCVSCHGYFQETYGTNPAMTSFTPVHH